MIDRIYNRKGDIVELRLLEYFIVLCEQLHFTKAAEKLRISQPTLSHQIKLLEGYIGTPLFERVGKKIFITQAGIVLLEHSNKIFYELNQADIKIKEIQNLKRGNLSIGCSGNHLITSPVISFNKQFPEIELSIQALTTQETITGILNNKIDLGVIFSDMHNEHIKFIPLFTEEFYLAVSTHHELSHRDSIDFKELKNIQLTFLPQRYFIRKLIDTLCEEEGFAIHPKIELTSLDSLYQMVQFNEIATILPKSYIESINDPYIKQLSIIHPTPQKTIGLVYRKDAYIDATMGIFIKHLLQNYNINTTNQT